MGSNPAAQGKDSPKSADTFSALKRELLIFGIAVAFGLIVMPFLIWLVGNRVLGPYTHGQDTSAGTGPLRLLADYFSGLTHGSIVFWCVALGPYVLLCFARALYTLLRSTPTTSSTRP